MTLGSGWDTVVLGTVATTGGATFVTGVLVTVVVVAACGEDTVVRGSSATGAVTSPKSGGSRRDLSTFAYSSSTGDKSDRSLSELHGSVKLIITETIIYYRDIKYSG